MTCHPGISVHRTVASALVLCCALATASGLPAADALNLRARPSGQLLPGPVKQLARGRLLVAVRGLPDPNFAETVVLLTQFSREGAMGVIVNRRTEVPVARVFPHLKPAREDPPLLYFGGPVAPTGVLGLLRSEAPQEGAHQVMVDVYMSAEREPLEALIVAGAGPDRFRVYLGYAGWGGGQLERETAQGSWHVLAGEADLVFDPEPESLWQRQIRRTDERMARRVPGVREPSP